MSLKSSQETVFDICIIGSGLAGLSSAYYIRKKTDKLNIILLDGNDRIGGRTSSHYGLSNSTQIHDFGGEWLTHDQCYIDWLINSLNLQIENQFNEGKKIWNFSFFTPSTNNVCNIEFDQESYTTGLKFGIFCRIIWALYINKVNSINKFMHKNLLKKQDTKSEMYANFLDSHSIRSYRAYKYLSKMHIQLMNVTHRLLFGCETSQIPFLFYNLYSLPPTSYQGFGIYGSLMNTTTNSQTYRIKGGAYGACQKICDSLVNVPLLLKHCVIEIIEDRIKEHFIIKCSNGKQVFSKRIICAIPPNCVASINFKTQTPLAIELQSAFKHQQPGRILKFVITYPTTFWRKLGYSGQVVNCPQEISCPAAMGKNALTNNANPDDLEAKYGYFCSRRNRYIYKGPSIAPFDCIFDTSSSGVSSLSGFIAGDTYNFWADKKEEERTVAITTYLNFVWKTTKATEFLQYMEHDWTKVDLCNGGPVCVPAVGFTRSILALREPHDDRIYFAGTETADFDMGTMSGAVQSGLRAAATCLSHTWPELVSAHEAKGMRSFDLPDGLTTKSPIYKIKNDSLKSKTMKAINVLRLLATATISLNFGVLPYGNAHDSGMLSI